MFVCVKQQVSLLQQTYIRINIAKYRSMFKIHMYVYHLNLFLSRFFIFCYMSAVSTASFARSPFLDITVFWRHIEV